MLSPKRVLDLAVVQTSNSEAVLSYTEVGDGEGNVAKIDVRYMATPISWGAEQATSFQVLPNEESEFGRTRRVVILLDGLFGAGAPGIGYQVDFQTISYRGNLRTAADQFPDPPATFPDVGDDGERLGNVATLTIQDMPEPEEPDEPDVVVVGEIEITAKQVVDQTGQKWESVNVTPRFKTPWGTFQLKLAKEID